MATNKVINREISFLLRMLWRFDSINISCEISPGFFETRNFPFKVIKNGKTSIEWAESILVCRSNMHYALEPRTRMKCNWNSKNPNSNFQINGLTVEHCEVSCIIPIERLIMLLISIIRTVTWIFVANNNGWAPQNQNQSQFVREHVLLSVPRTCPSA